MAGLWSFLDVGGVGDAADVLYLESRPSTAGIGTGAMTGVAELMEGPGVFATDIGR